MPTRRTRASDARCGTTTRASARWWSSRESPVEDGRGDVPTRARRSTARARGDRARARVSIARRSREGGASCAADAVPVGRRFSGRDRSNGGLREARDSE